MWSHDATAVIIAHIRHQAKRSVSAVIQLGGLTMKFRGWTYALEQYSLALEQAGVRIEAVREPRPIDAAGNYERWRAVPLFPSLRAVKA